MSMGKPVFRNPDKVPLLAERIWLRHYMPTGEEGFVAEDADLIIDIFGPLVGRSYDADGRLMLVQVKYGAVRMPYAQKRIYGLMHKLMRKGDPDKYYYRGCYLLQWFPKEVTLDGQILSLSSDSDLQELERRFQDEPDTIQRAQWWIDHKHGHIARVRINEQKESLTLDEFGQFLLGELDIPSLFDQDSKQNIDDNHTVEQESSP